MTWQSLRRLVCIVLATITLIQQSAHSQLPDIGSAGIRALTKAQEQALGDSIMRTLKYSLPINADPLVSEYIQNLGSQLVSNSSDAGQPYHFFVINDPAINAFALPGGYIGINSGLILTTEHEGELASVLSHEIAHVTQRHIARMFERSSQMNLGLIAGLVGALILGTQSSQAASGALAATLGGSYQSQINFTRDNEEEADRIGISILANSGYDSRDMPAFFARLGRANQFNDISGYPEYLRTHPITHNRIADSAARAERYPKRQHQDSLDYFLVKAKLRIDNQNNARRNINWFAEQIKQQTGLAKQAAQYGYALSLLQASQYQQAAEQIDQLLAQYPQVIAYQLLLAEINSEQGQSAQALERLLPLYQRQPNHLGLLLAIAQLSIYHSDSHLAQQLLTDYVRNHKDCARVYQLLAMAEAELGDTVNAQRHQAEYLALIGDDYGAINQLEKALKHQGLSDYLKARITARLTELKEQAQRNH